MLHRYCNVSNTDKKGAMKSVLPAEGARPTERLTPVKAFSFGIAASRSDGFQEGFFDDHHL